MCGVIICNEQGKFGTDPNHDPVESDLNTGLGNIKTTTGHSALGRCVCSPRALLGLGNGEDYWRGTSVRFSRQKCNFTQLNLSFTGSFILGLDWQASTA